MFAYTLNLDSWSVQSPGVKPTPREKKQSVTLIDAFRAKYPEWLFILNHFKPATGKNPTWQALTKSNLIKFVDHLQNTFAPNTANQYAVRLKAVLNIYADEIKLPGDYAKILSPRKIPSTSIYLTEEELKRLEDYTPRSTNETFVRNMFLCSAYTGARWSDVQTLNASNIRDNEIIFVAQKTRKEARLPLKPIVRDYILNTPRVVLSEISYNKIIRRICRAVGIVERVKILKAGQEIELDKCDAVSSHTARKSFASNLYSRGVDLYTISRLLQHSSVELTKKYICANIRALNSSEMEYFS